MEAERFIDTCVRMYVLDVLKINPNTLAGPIQNLVMTPKKTYELFRAAIEFARRDGNVEQANGNLPADAGQDEGADNHAPE